MEISGSRSFTLSLAFLLLGFCSETCNAKDDTSAKSCTSSCGHIHNISYPFRLNHDPKHCGNVMYTLSCESNITVLDIPSSGKYYVQAINYDKKTIRLLDFGLQSNNCSSMPQKNISPNTNLYGSWPSTPIYYLMCSNPLNPSLYVDTAPCLNNTSSSSSQPKTYSYVKVGAMIGWELDEGCSVEWMTLGHFDYSVDIDYSNVSYKEIHNALVYGFELDFRTFGTRRCQGWTGNYGSACFPYTIPGFFQYLWQQIGHEYIYWSAGKLRPGLSMVRGWFILICIGLFFLARFVFGVPIVTAFLIYTWRRRHLSMYSTIEDFLQCNNNFMPIRYSYLDVKKMTCRFKDKLGEGGFGSVFKGKLRSGRFVAVKVLGKPKADGQDFISEIATIGRIHHANVVQLVGYCVEGSKRALVYDFMPNGSLDKYIYSKEGSVPLTIKNMYEISLGVAQGIEYLHQGCEMQILHFDIKPHNILLDENFKAKISDFGLAKLYPVNNSIVSLTAARGTMGYIAPELFYKNIGGVSYKADVYSFGMLLMEMASRRKNLNAMVEHSSQIYFPLWVYDQYIVGNDLEMDNITEEEKKVIRKMVLTALWCIQMKPSDRPSMSKVVEMLGGDVECLQMPLKPSLCPQEAPVTAGDIQDNELNPICSNAELTCSLSAR
ncbi:LEAF RUST 10 DISEASE-RESISTANCE LOCUS RECEPTOR-LIKE PROTEIN KINASE-like 2.1 isoform X4 [Malus sylvestris]|uniref:LEAF RUST 10 DISEASE-RESISTANCE LOCUS RECEPTOR-LIKE PROTEIN KINASE-like 2.1 isoform X4 n=1 Tax=Malus sylvestris TaxID=3752 RepID=UPI0021AC5C79|nr:LEAF RUST 10 DISEASE-RESISTANCE LOCUS RECEPTOR-LIKE PROTEIN KINASE-like 2.1 isoform X4 [Malus sylvestris]